MKTTVPVKTTIAFLLAGLMCCVSVAAYAEYPTGLSARSIKKLERQEAKQKKKNKKNNKKKENKKPNKGNKNGLGKVCGNVQPLKKALLKNAWPGHINRSDPRAPGFAFVCGPDCPKKFPVSAYYSDGTAAFKLGYYGRWEGNGRPRAYCGAGGVGTCSASGVAKASRQKGRDGKVYLDFGNKSCRSATPGQRNGSPF